MTARFFTFARAGIAASAVLLSSLLAAGGAEPATVSSTQSAISYYSEKALQNADDYQKELCKLDVVYPANKTGFATVIWFHGGGLTGGRRSCPVFDPSVATVGVEYRLLPKVKSPGFLEDAAAATAWVINNIDKFGGDPHKIFIAGHSAGAYLASMVGMDPQWLAGQGLSNHQLAGIIPVSGQMTTHFAVKKLRGDTGDFLRPLIDEYAPLYHVSKDLPPICLITGDRRVEFKCRVEENVLMDVTLRQLGHPNVKFYEMGGLDHLGVEQGARLIIAAYVKEISSQIDAKEKTAGKP